MNQIARSVAVNEVKISQAEIDAEVQFHPARSIGVAKREATQALVVRELLLQRAIALGLCNRPDGLGDLDETIDALLKKEIQVPQPDEAVCRRFFQNNEKRFMTSPLFEVSHILYLVKSKDEQARGEALALAEQALARLTENAASFAEIAKAESACSSAKMDGRLGQISKGQTSPAFEKALFKMKEGEISTEPLATEFGFHIIKVHKRLEGQALPFSAVQDWIEEHLRQESWQRAFSQYIQVLAGKAEIKNFHLKQAGSPLVQ